MQAFISTFTALVAVVHILPSLLATVTGLDTGLAAYRVLRKVTQQSERFTYDFIDRNVALAPHASNGDFYLVLHHCRGVRRR